MTVAYKLKNAAAIGTVATDLYTVPVSTVGVVTGLILANRSAGAITVSVQITDSSAGVQTYIVKDAPIPVAGAIVPIGDGNKQNLEAADKITITSSAAGSCDATASIMEES